MTYAEDHVRSITKTLTVRVCFTLSHILNGFIVTGSLMMGIQIATFATLINMILFWSHERIWNYFQWNRTSKNPLMFKEGHPRTISKSVTWRILITINNFAIPYFTTGSWQTALTFATIATFLNIAVYYFHERVWNSIRWRKIIT